jgi:S-(hydroxymethyl)glutathione dehydrogenase / alcohol dehydrogenase
LRTRAAVFFEPGRPLDLADIDVEEPGPSEVVVRVDAVGICGTDLHQLRGEWRRPTPMVLGHEGAGVIESVGSAVDPARIGQEVVLTWAASCQSCPDCARGRPAACSQLHAAIAGGTLVGGQTKMSLDGRTLYRATATGALAERLVVQERLALPFTSGVSLQEAALLGCAATTGVGSVLFAARVQRGSGVLVVGLGGVGQFCVQAARIAGASAIIGVDPVAARRQQALDAGATHVAEPDDLEDLVSRVMPDGVHASFDVVGTSATTQLSLRLTRAGGSCVIVGLPPQGERLSLDFADFNRKEKWLGGTMYGSEDPAVALPVLLHHVRSGSLDLASMVGPIYSLEQVNEAFDASMAGSAKRVLVSPSGALSSSATHDQGC